MKFLNKVECDPMRPLSDWPSDKEEEVDQDWLRLVEEERQKRKPVVVEDARSERITNPAKWARRVERLKKKYRIREKGPKHGKKDTEKKAAVEGEEV